MMDDLLRDTFTRHEELVPDAAVLRPAIAAGVRRRRVRRRWAWSGSALALVLLLAAPLALLQHGPRRDVTGETLSASTHPMHFLLLGTDRRPGDTGSPVRADAILLLHVDPATRTAYQISIPRDLLLDLPGFGRERANSAYLFGGYSLTAESITALTGVPIDGGAVVDFSGMQAVTKAVGGVDLCVDERTESLHLAYDRHGGITPRTPGLTPVVYEVGCRHFEAWEALDYLRQRPGTTADRDRHLRQFLAALAKQLADPVKLAKALPLAGQALDLHLGGASLASMAGTLSKLDPANVPGVRLPSRPEGGALAAVPGGDGLFAALRTGTVASWVAAHPQYIS